MAVFCVVAPRSRAIALMKEAASTSETSVQFCQSTRRNNYNTAVFMLATVRTRNLTHLCLFDDSVGSSNAQRRTMESLLDDEFEKVWMEAVVAYFKVVSWRLHGGTEEKHDKLQSGQHVSRSTLPWFQILAGASRILRFSCVVM
jgi:phosphoribosylpyrophosphate synthetase